MKLIYWNTKEIADFSSIFDILKDESPDIFFLSETKEEIIVANSMELDKLNYEYFLNPGCKRINILKKKPLKVNLGKQSSYYTSIKETHSKLTIISVHLPSQMYQSNDALKSFLRDFRNEIDDEIGNSLIENIIIMGDFNVNPFEKPMIDFDGFAASNTVNLRSEATHLTKKKSLYYNPTWLLYKNNHFPGTKYFKRPSGFSYDILEHHFLDQVVLSYKMIKNIQNEKISVLEKTTNFSYFNAITNNIELSDHLPLIYEFDLI